MACIGKLTFSGPTQGTVANNSKHHHISVNRATVEEHQITANSDCGTRFISNAGFRWVTDLNANHVLALVQYLQFQTQQMNH